MTRCAVRGCKSGTYSNNLYNIQNNIRPPTVFMVPKSPTALAKWKAALNQDLSPKARVCELHFSDAYVLRSDDTLMPDGSIFSLPRQKFGLHKNAVPKDVGNQENKAPETEQIYTDENGLKVVENVAHHENDKETSCSIDQFSSNELQIKSSLKVYGRIQTSKNTSIDLFSLKSKNNLSHETVTVGADKNNIEDTSLNDHQYYMDINKPEQYCYYNRRIAACFTIPSLNNNFVKISGEEKADPNRLCLTDNNTTSVEHQPTEENLSEQVTKSKNIAYTPLHVEQNISLTIGNVINYLLNNPLRRAWSWMKFTKRDKGITFTQIHIKTRKIRCHIELYEDMSIMIQTGDEKISLEIEFEIQSTDNILNLLETVEKVKICTGTGYDHESRDKECLGILPTKEEYETATCRDRCTACKKLRKQLRVREKFSRVDIKMKYEKAKKELDLLRRRCKYYEGRLSLKNKRLKIITEMIRSFNKKHKNVFRSTKMTS